MSEARDWRRQGWLYAATAMLAFAAFAVTHVLGGAGFIGAFVAGLAFAFGCGAKRPGPTQVGEIGTVFSLVTWLVFGAATDPRPPLEVSPRRSRRAEKR